jgi:hypothetical protein
LRIKAIDRMADNACESSMRATREDNFQTDHDLRRLRAEIESALRCGELLDRLGVRFRFWPDPAGNGVRIEVCGPGGGSLGSVTPRQLLRLLEGGPSDIETWAVLVGAIELDGRAHPGLIPDPDRYRGRSRLSRRALP